MRTPRTLASSTSARSTRSGGSASPAGEAVPRLPPIVPRFRICGEPTVRDASASAGSALGERPRHRLGVRQAAPSRSAPSSRDQPRSSSSSARLTSASGRDVRRSELDHHVRAAVDGRASGRAAFSRSASSSVRRRHDVHAGRQPHGGSDHRRVTCAPRPHRLDNRDVSYHSQHGRDDPTDGGRAARGSARRGARAAFARGGLHGTSTEEIAEAAGISQPYLFRLFGTKKRLFVATRRALHGRHARALPRRPPATCVGRRRSTRWATRTWRW